MNRARIEGTNSIVKADELLEHYPNYKSLIFVCIDENCSVQMAPSCIKKDDKRRAHFKKYRNRDHVETCEYATLNELYLKGKNQKLNKTEIKKIGYPSVFNLKEDLIEIDENTSQSSRKNDKEGITGQGNKTKLYEFDEENIKFDRKNRVQSIDRIVDWYLGFPRNRDVELEVKGIKIPYMYFFKKIKENTEPEELQNERIFYGVIMLSDKNRNIFDKYPNSVYITLLGYKDIDKEKGLPNNYTVRIDKKSISKRANSIIKNKYESLFEKAFSDFKDGKKEPNFELFVFVYGTIDEENNVILNVHQNYITFRYDEVRKTVIED